MVQHGKSHRASRMQRLHGRHGRIYNLTNLKKMETIKVEMKPNGIEMECDKNEFALALKTWRLRSGLTQQQVAEQWGCSRYTIMRAENAKQVTWEMAYRLFAKLAGELRKEPDNG